MGLRAALVTLLTPGAGHALVGRPRRGAMWFAAAWLCLLSSPWTGIIGICAGLLVVLGTIVDAAIIEQHPTGSSITVGLFFAATAVLWICVRLFYMQSFKIPSAAMLPTMAIGDHFMVAKWRTQPARGDIVLFIYPVDPEKDMVKRVVGMPNDRIEVRNGILYVNGNPATDGEGVPCGLWDYDEIRVRWTQMQAVCMPEKLDGTRFTVAHSQRDWGGRDIPETRVPPGHVYVLGDNRENSQDSRFWGPLPIGNIKGKPMVIWWSFGEPEGMRWSRIGTRL